MKTRSIVPAVLLLVPSVSRAQCADGTPPPCAVARATPARPVPPPDQRARRFLLLPFRNVTRATTQDWLVTGAPLMLGEALAQYRDLRVVPEEQLTAARRRLKLTEDAPDATQLKRLAQETDGWTAVSGNLYATGPRVRITVQALDVTTSQVLVRAETEVAADADVRQAFNDLGVKLLETAGVKGATLDVAARTTHSVDAYKAYVEGLEFMRASAFHRAQLKFQDAVRLDSTFAYAWARLAMAGIGWNVQNILNPLGVSYRAIEQATKYASRLPERQAQTVRAWQAFFRGQTGRARTLIDSLLAADKDDLDAREMSIVLNILDPLLDPSSPSPRLLSSQNRAVLTAREVLDRDPGRRWMFSVMGFVYGSAAGLWGGGQGGVRKEAGSLAAMMQQGSDAFFYPVLRDSLEWVPSDNYYRIPPEQRTQLRRRATDAGMEWIERWIATSDADAEAHLWASRLSELREDYPRAMRELARAESLGVETSMEPTIGRRMGLLVRAGEYQAAAKLADSLLTAGVLARAPFPSSTLDRTRQSGTAALLLTRNWKRLSDLAPGFSPPATGAPCSGINSMMQSGGDYALPPVIRKRAMDTVAFHFGEAAAYPVLQRCLETLSGALAYDSTTARRTAAGAALLAAADSLQAAGNSANAYRAARVAWSADTVRRAAISARPWFAARSRALAVGADFAAGEVFLEGDSVTVTFRRSGSDPLLIDSPGLATNSYFYVAARSIVASDTATFRLLAAHTSAPVAEGATGDLAAFVAALNSRDSYMEDWTFKAPIPRGTVTVVRTSDGFRVVLRGPMAQEWARLKPASARIFSAPCLGVSAGLCTGVTVPIVYR